ncbi:uncharacterized protein [Musca autumnalis]|uniref:uncharacterized protein n=1 Tax=Musca autumnalis TaxID=221902 RepID=UPI003CEE73BE
MENALNVELMEIAARSLYYIRQSRVLIIAQNIINKQEFMDTCLNLLQEYPMTNVLLHFIESSQEIPLDYQQLKPYPKFHWQFRSLRETKLVYYPQHWRNLHGVNITTHTDQSIPATVAYKDVQGNWKLNGHVARLVLLFVEHFNGTLRMYKTLNEGEVDHFTIVADMATKRLIDIAMCLHVISTPGHSTWIYASDVYEIGQDLSVMGGIMLDIFRSLVITENITEYVRMRFDFNTTTGYYAALSQWKLFSLKQKYHRYKSFCTYDNLTVHRFIPWNIILQPNSQFKEAFNYLLHRVHQAGMLDAWYASAFYDLVKLKRLSLVDPNPERGPQAMTVDDLQIAWLVIVIGLVVSGAIFFLELWYYHNFRYRD